MKRRKLSARRRVRTGSALFLCVCALAGAALWRMLAARVTMPTELGALLCFGLPAMIGLFFIDGIQLRLVPSRALSPAQALWLALTGVLAVCPMTLLADVPGALAPQTYFQSLKDGDFAPLMKILEHNKQDIVSLAQLFYFLCSQVDQPERICEGEDLFSLAKAMEKRGEREKAMKCYRMSAEKGLLGESYQAMARLEKRQGNCDAAVKLYQAMLTQGKEPVATCEALAKLYEHQLKDIAGALSYTRQALLLLSEPTLFHDATVQERQKALQYRYSRLRRKLSDQSR